MPRTAPELVAGGDIRPFRFIKIDSTPGASHTGLEADANDELIGVCGGETNYAPLSGIITTNLHAKAGQPIKLHGDGEETLLELGDTVTQGQKLKSDNDGLGVPIASIGTTLQRYGAIALENGAAGERIRVQVLLGSERPALA